MATTWFTQSALPTDEVVNFTNQVKQEVETAKREEFPEYTPVLYSKISPSTDETFYHVKVQVGCARYLDLQVITRNNIPTFHGVSQPGGNPTRESRLSPELKHGLASDAALPTLLVQIGTKEVKPNVETATGRIFPDFNAVLFRQLLRTDGKTYYWVKVQVSDESYVHMSMFTNPIGPVLPALIFHYEDYQYPKNKNDPITIFP